MILIKRILKYISTVIANIFIVFIKVYKLFLSPLLPQSCRFYPTCSHYSMEAFKRHGAISGLYLTIRRVLRCHPFNDGGFDPVPEQFQLIK
jgi:putative membrane protein insertion efficiency factor